MELKRLTWLLTLIILATLLTPLAGTQVASASGVGIHSDFPHARVVVTEVVDGDTIHISPALYVAGQYRTDVRFADINAPELTTPEGQAAKVALTNLLAQYGGVVYLDISQSPSQVDDYGRILAVVYVRVNATTLMNVNKWLVENGYASIIDYTNNDFDPSQWSLYVNYEVAKENMPTVTRVVLASLPQGIAYNTSWGVKVATTPDRNYIGVVFSEYGTYHLWVVILDKNGNVVRRVNLSNVATQYGLPATNVYRGMVSIAGNNSGFLVAWNQYSATIGGTSYSRITMYTYVPINPNQPIQYDTQNKQFFYLYGASYQYHPHTAWYCDASGNCYWIIGYHSLSTSTSGSLNLSAVKQDLVTKIPSGVFPIVLTTKTATTSSTGIGVGVDVMSGFLYDPATKSFVWVARNYTDTTGYDLELVKGSVNSASNTLVVDRIPVDNNPGDVGPTTDFYTTTGGVVYTYNNVYPMHTALLGGGGYVLTAYNVSSSALGYAVVDLNSKSVNRQTLVDLGPGSATTFYPWIAGGGSKWLLAYSTGGYVNPTLVATNGSNTGLVPLSDRNSSYVRATYDPGSGLSP